MARKRKPNGYGNRSDLAVQPVRAPSGGAYGQRQALEQAQQAVPLPKTPPAPAAPNVGPGTPIAPRPERAARAAEAPRGETGLEAALAAAQLSPFSGGGLGAPSNRPTEPVTAGLPVGPGVGPTPRVRLGDTLREISERSADPDIAYLATLVDQAGW